MITQKEFDVLISKAKNAVIIRKEIWEEYNLEKYDVRKFLGGRDYRVNFITTLGDFGEFIRDGICLWRCSVYCDENFSEWFDNELKYRECRVDKDHLELCFNSDCDDYFYGECYYIALSSLEKTKEDIIKELDIPNLDDRLEKWMVACDTVTPHIKNKLNEINTIKSEISDIIKTLRK